MQIEQGRNLNNYDNGMKNFTIQIVSVGELHDFSNQPFKVKNDLEMFELMKSIETYGVLVPLIVRSNKQGPGYEIISGHRRKEACRLLRVETIPVIINQSIWWKGFVNSNISNRF